MKPAAASLALLLLAIAGAPRAAAPAPLPVPEAMREIAAAEDDRRWADGVLRGLLAHPDPVVRVRAALATGRLQDSTSVDALMPLLSDKLPEVRREAIFALGQIGHRSARPTLERMLADKDEGAKSLALEALGKLGDKAATANVKRFLSSPSALLRGDAAVALWRLADSTAIPELLDRRSDADPGVRWRVLYALEKIVAPDRIVLPAALALSDADPLVRAHAARTIGREKSTRGTAYLLQALADPDAGVVVQSIRALQLVGDSLCAPCAASIGRQLDHADPYVRVTAAVALADPFAWASVDSAERVWTTAQLESTLRDPDAATRGASARALVARGGVEGYVLAGPVLSDSSVYARVALLDGFRVMPERRLYERPQLAADVLGASLRPDRPLLQRMTAAEIIGQLGGRTHLVELESLKPRVRAGLDEPELLMVAACAGALGDWGDTASVRRLAAAYAARAKDADADARIAIRDALRALGARALADSVERVHAAAAAPIVRDEAFFAEPDARGAILHTTAGDIEWEFARREAPQTVKNFVRLARRGYFDGLAVHRVVPDFVIQDGDPTGTGSGGPGHTIRCEYNRLRYDAGMVGMALSGKDTGGSQWFVTHSPQPHLNGRYTIFAHVTRGLDVAKSVTQGALVRRVEIIP